MFTKQEKQIAVSIVLLSIISQFSIDIYLPSLPYIARYFHAPAHLIKASLSFFLLGFGLAQITSGAALDIYGRRPVAFVGFGIFLTSTIFCIFSNSAIAIILFRFFQGFGAGFNSTTFKALLRDNFKEEKLATASAWTVLCWSMGSVIAPAIGGHIQQAFGWRANFIFLFVFGSGIYLYFYFIVKETKVFTRFLTIKTILSNYVTVCLSPTFLIYTAIFSLAYAYVMAYATAAPFILQDLLNLSPAQFGWIFFIIASGYGISSLCSSKLAKKIKSVHLLFIGSTLSLLGSAIFLTFALFKILSVFTFVAPIYISTLGGGLLLSNCLSCALAPHKENVGTAAAVLGFIQLLIAFLVSLITAFLPSKTSLHLGIFLFILSTTIFCTLFFGLKKTSNKEV